MRKIIKIDGVDYTDLFTPTGYSVSYKKVRGGNSGQMMDGTYYDDVIRTKAVVTCICMPLDENKLSDLLVAVSNTYVTVEYWDPKIKAYREAEMMPSDPSQKFRGSGANMLDYWTGTVLQFEEK